MRISILISCVAAALLAGCASPSDNCSCDDDATNCVKGSTSPAPPAPPTANLADFQRRAAAFHEILSLPHFETTTNDIAGAVTTTVAAAETALDAIGKLTPEQVNFANTALALDDVDWRIGETANRLTIIKETSTDATLRDAATEQIKKLEEWSVGLDYREDVYRAMKAYADTHPPLKGEERQNC